MPLPEHIEPLIQKQDPTIDSINLENYGLCDDDIDELIPLLNNNSHITSLLLHRNNITEIGAKKLANLIYIKFLDLSSNHIIGNDTENILALAKSTIKELDLKDNLLSIDCLEVFASHSEQYEIYFDKKGVMPGVLEAIKQRLEENQRKIYTPSLFSQRQPFFRDTKVKKGQLTDTNEITLEVLGNFIQTLLHKSENIPLTPEIIQKSAQETLPHDVQIFVTNICSQSGSTEKNFYGFAH